MKFTVKHNHNRMARTLLLFFLLATGTPLAAQAPLNTTLTPTSPQDNKLPNPSNGGKQPTSGTQNNRPTNPNAGKTTQPVKPPTTQPAAQPASQPTIQPAEQQSPQPTAQPATQPPPSNPQTQPQNTNPVPSESPVLVTKKRLIEEGYQVCTTHPNFGVIYCKKAETGQKLSRGQSAYTYCYIDSDGLATPVDASLVQPTPDKQNNGEQTTDTAPENPLDKGLVAYYPFNANANDESGHQNNGIVYGAKPTIDRFNRPSSAYKFNGTSDYIMVKNSSALCPERFTISLWAILSPTVSNNYLRLLSKHIDQPGSYGSYQILTGTVEQPLRCLGTAITNSGYVVSESNTATVPGWHHLVLTWDGASLNFYVDQVLVQQEGWSGTPKYDANPLYIGKDGFYPNSYFSGVIDDIRIYNRALSDNEISNLFGEN